MKQFDYTIKDPIGIHARPAGNLAALAKSFKDSTFTITKGDMTVKLGQLMKVMSMGIKCGDTVRIGVEGPDEEKVAAAIEDFLKNNL